MALYQNGHRKLISVVPRQAAGRKGTTRTDSRPRGSDRRQPSHASGVLWRRWNQVLSSQRHVQKGFLAVVGKRDALLEMCVKILIVHRSQFGYHPYYYYCLYGRRDASITYLCFRLGRPRIELDGVNLVEVPTSPLRMVRYLRFLYATWRQMRDGYDVVFMAYFPGCSLLSLLNRRANLVLDILTGAVDGRKIWRLCSDILQAIESHAFRHVAVLSSGLGKKLHLPKRRMHVLPLGGEPRPLRQKDPQRLDLLYIGTLDQRDIHKTILGLSYFRGGLGRGIELTYTIVGRGKPGVERHLRALIDELRLTDIVTCVGYVHHSDLQPYYDRCNVGVAFVPINEVFDVQPPTKTYEYLLAGMPVVATATMENKAVMTANMGVLIDDTPECFAEGLATVYHRLPEYTPDVIQEAARVFAWSSVVQDNMMPYLRSTLPRSGRRNTFNEGEVEDRHSCRGASL